MKITFSKRIFFYFLLIFALYTTCIIIIEQKDEKKYKTEALENKLDGYSDMIYSFINKENLRDSTMASLSEIVRILPSDIRVTVIDENGKVLYDKDVDNLNSLDNHLERPEIRMALLNRFGTNIRTSVSTQQEYLYYAKSYKDYFVRVALPYNIETKSLMKADNWFIYFVLILFVFVLILLNFVAGQFGKSINMLKSFTSNIKGNKPLPNNLPFPNDELGEIGKELADIFQQKERSKIELEQEKDKLIRHIQHSKEGLGIFDSNFCKIYANTYFIQYVNLFSDSPIFNINVIFDIKEFVPIKDFIKNPNRNNYFKYNIKTYGKKFEVAVVIFEDRNFEISIKNITKAEKNKLLKQEITNNIAHELKTPVTGLRGFLETLVENNLDEEKAKMFLERAYMQSIRLSNIIEDVSIISKMEETGSKFSKENVNINELINDIRIDLSNKLEKNNIKFVSSVKDDVYINGNYSLLYSVFRNLADNSINYGGTDIEIDIKCYWEDETHYYFSFHDNGVGVDKSHLNRIFERFYRVDKGRTRDTGGSGLGLSIVKNAILLHDGNIQVKNRETGGLEFLFTLKK